MYLLGWVGGAEFCGEVGEVGECQLSGIGTLADANIDYVAGDEVATGSLLSILGKEKLKSAI